MSDTLFQLRSPVSAFKTQLLKWVGNKQRYAHEIASYFPADYGTYFEPFLGSGAVLATLAPQPAVGSDVFGPLVSIFQVLQQDPERLKQWYTDRWSMISEIGKQEAYERVRVSYNAKPNAADLLFLSRACYGGVIRFRRDGVMSTPCGAHSPVSPASFASRVDEWHRRTVYTRFIKCDYRDAMDLAKEGDLVYCDPPYSNTQKILYGAQHFELQALLDVIAGCKNRGVAVALSIDGTKRSGRITTDLPIPDGLFEREVRVNCGRSMLKRFQLAGETLESEVVTDRLLLTY